MEIWWDRRRQEQKQEQELTTTTTCTTTTTAEVDKIKDIADVWIIDDKRNENENENDNEKDDSAAFTTTTTTTTPTNNSKEQKVRKIYTISSDGKKLQDVETQATVGVVVHLNNNHDNNDNDNNHSSATGQEEAFAAIGSVEWIYVVIDEDEDDDGMNEDNSRSSSSKWQMIPAENLIAAAQYTGTKIAFRVSQPSNVLGLSNALELGVDALCIKEEEDNTNDNTSLGEEYDDHSTTSILWKIVYQARTERMNNNSNNDSNDALS
eukprot:CAMPEP_0170930778 /NCGR_PEP_ID=MMETSP0735-20130129/15722_1 /TAXON_ID=186038 /ORGANISM="Fragilariopsis kerguelensis, Strain L26-C5" /LENGTH=264 /DNA_ID=CAMNT_0011332395 /DNA_START=314 /DNA_END=1105 /DNA_ORIENTATION=-